VYRSHVHASQLRIVQPNIETTVQCGDVYPASDLSVYGASDGNPRSA
jgi:hypothetical protein